MSENNDNAPELTSEEVKPIIFALPDNAEKAELEAIMKSVWESRITTEKPVPEPERLISMGTAPILRQGSMCFVCGKAGSRKTTALTLMCADMMRPGVIANSPFTIPRPLKILFVDTEQHPYDTQRINDRVVNLIDDGSSLHLYPLANIDPRFIPSIIEQLVMKIRPDVCVVDNVAHMGRGIIMDIDAAELLVRNLRRLAVTYQTAVIGVIHMNEGNDSKRPRGHGGAEAVREGDLVLQFVADEGDLYSVAEAMKARCEKPQKWGVAIDTETKLPYYRDISETPTITEKASNPDKYADIVAKIPNPGMTHAELSALIRTTKNKSVSTAKTWVGNMVKAGAVVKHNSRYYRPGIVTEGEQLPFDEK